MLNLIIEFAVKEIDDDWVYVCAAPTAKGRMTLNSYEKHFFQGLLPKRSKEIDEGLWECRSNSNIANRLMVNGIRPGKKAEGLVKWYIDNGTIEEMSEE